MSLDAGLTRVYGQDMNTTIPVLATTAHLVTAQVWDRFTARATDLCEWYTNADEALDRYEYLNAQADRDGRRRYTRVKMEAVNHDA